MLADNFGVGGGLAYLVYIQLSRTYHIEIWLLPVFIISALTIALAFLKIHGLPFYQFILHYIEYNPSNTKLIITKMNY